MTFRLSIETGASVLGDAVYVAASSISSNVVTKERQEKKIMTAKQIADVFKLELPVEGNKWSLEMNTKTKRFIQGIYETEI